MNVTPKAVETAVIRAKDVAQAAGVAQQHLDAVAATLAMVELLGNTLQSAVAVPTNAGPKLAESFAEWARRYALKGSIDHFVAIAVYLYDNKQVAAISVRDIDQMYDKARWSDKPKNLADTFARAAQKLYFAEAEAPEESDGKGPKLWRLTPTGYEYFQSLRKEK